MRWRGAEAMCSLTRVHRHHLAALAVYAVRKTRTNSRIERAYSDTADDNLLKRHPPSFAQMYHYAGKHIDPPNASNLGADPGLCGHRFC